MRVLVCGSRHFNDYNLLSEVLNKHDITCIIEGGARGADTLARKWADEKDLECETYMAEWDTYGKAAGPIRNQHMLDWGEPALIIAFLAPDSRGTKHMISIAQKAGIPVKIVEIGNETN